jgi:hypothetical protein
MPPPGFATSGFSYDANLSPNNSNFSQAALAVVLRNGQLVEGAIQPFLPGGGTSVATASFANTAGTLAAGGFANPSNKVSGTATNGTSTLAMRSDAAPALDVSFSYIWTGNNIFNPATGTPLIVQLGNTTAFEVVGTASLAGRGPQAAALVDMTPDAVTFIGTLAGVTPVVMGTMTARRMGNFGFITGSLIGTSNANTLSMSGLPAAWQPAVLQFCICNLEDNGGNAVGAAEITNSGTITFGKGGVSGTAVAVGGSFFTTTGQKGLNSTVIGPYILA